MASDVNLQTFESIFKENYQLLLLTAFQIIKDKDIAKDTVQDFFIDFWENRDKKEVTNFQSYAVRAIKNLSFSYIRKDISEEVKIVDYKYTIDDEVQLDIISLEEEFKKQQHTETQLSELLNLLPEKRRNIFISYVVDELSYEQIAEKYGISINTVKTQMQRSYKFLKSYIKENSLNSVLATILFSSYLNNI